MIYSSIITILIVLMVSIEIYFIGKYFSKVSGIFEFNEAGSLVVGTIVYFFITFIAFFPFIWLKPTIFYFAIVLAIKEGAQIVFLSLRRDTFYKMKPNYKLIGFTFISMLTFPLIFGFELSNYLHLGVAAQTSDFQSWSTYNLSISKITRIDTEFIYKWFSGAIISLLAYTSITSIVIYLSKRKNVYDYLISFVITLGIMVASNYGLMLSDMAPIFLLTFGVQVAVQVIRNSRRRFSLIIGLIDFVIWFFNPMFFTATVALSIVLVLLYTYMQRNKTTLFWVQLISPLIIVATLWFYTISVVGALVLIVLATSSYIFMTSLGRLDRLDQFDERFTWARKWTPIATLGILIVTAVSIYFSTSINVKDAFIFNNAIFDSYDVNLLNDVQSYIYYAILGALIIFTIVNVGKRHNKANMTIILTSWIFVFGYSFIMNVILMDTIISDQFKYIRGLVFIPLLISSVMVIRNKIGRGNYEENRKWK